MEEFDCFSGPSQGSLQSNFKKFLKTRKEQIKQMTIKSNTDMQNRDCPIRKQALRDKFLDRAKSYIGVPYAKKFHEPDTEAYNSPIFLDCCALVRQAVDDLQDDFGFRIGRWNQAYQYDVLGPEISLEEMQPGDLVFYSATYYDTKKRRQIHDMVHVEIFIGGHTGEQSLGARWFKGAVQIFDTFKFVSTNYYDIRWHYKSIDLWLKGICQSQCLEHPWGTDRKYNWLTHNSIFAEDDGQENETNESSPEKNEQGV